MQGNQNDYLGHASDNSEIPEMHLIVFIYFEAALKDIRTGEGVLVVFIKHEPFMDVCR